MVAEVRETFKSRNWPAGTVTDPVIEHVVSVPVIRQDSASVIPLEYVVPVKTGVPYRTINVALVVPGPMFVAIVSLFSVQLLPISSGCAVVAGLGTRAPVIG